MSTVTHTWKPPLERRVPERDALKALPESVKARMLVNLHDVMVTLEVTLGAAARVSGLLDLLAAEVTHHQSPGKD